MKPNQQKNALLFVIHKQRGIFCWFGSWKFTSQMNSMSQVTIKSPGQAPLMFQALMDHLADRFYVENL